MSKHAWCPYWGHRATSLFFFLVRWAFFFANALYPYYRTSRWDSLRVQSYFLCGEHDSFCPRVPFTQIGPLAERCFFSYFDSILFAFGAASSCRVLHQDPRWAHTSCKKGVRAPEGRQKVAKRSSFQKVAKRSSKSRQNVVFSKGRQNVVKRSSKGRQKVVKRLPWQRLLARSFSEGFSNLQTCSESGDVVRTLIWLKGRQSSSLKRRPFDDLLVKSTYEPRHRIHFKSTNSRDPQKKKRANRHCCDNLYDCGATPRAWWTDVAQRIVNTQCRSEC